jgi:hypothetical protein
MHHDENTAAAVQAKRDPAIFLVTVRGIKDGERLRIMENRGSPLKTDAMVAQIVLGLDGIPRKNIPQRITSTARYDGFSPAAGAERLRSPAAGS